MKYELVVMNEDGDYEVDSKHNTIKSANEIAGKLGSKWIFYPFLFVTKMGKVIEELSNEYYNSNNVLNGFDISVVANMFRVGDIRSNEEF